jgi:autotransporter family porin
MNVDAMYAIWRSCYNGDEVWLNNEQKGQQYAAGDVWGCIGRWFAGSWYTPPAEQYISRVKQYLNQQVWLSPEFARTTSNPNG